MPAYLSAFLCRADRTDMVGFPGPSFLGVFSGLTASRFPLRLKQCIFVVQVADWLAGDEFHVEVARGDGVVFATEPRLFHALGLASPAWVQVPLDGAVLPEEGKYSVAMKVNGELFVARPLLVVRVQSKTA